MQTINSPSSLKLGLGWRERTPAEAQILWQKIDILFGAQSGVPPTYHRIADLLHWCHCFTTDVTRAVIQQVRSPAPFRDSGAQSWWKRHQPAPQPGECGRILLQGIHPMCSCKCWTPKRTPPSTLAVQGGVAKESLFVGLKHRGGNSYRGSPLCLYIVLRPGAHQQKNTEPWYVHHAAQPQVRVQYENVETGPQVPPSTLESPPEGFPQFTQSSRRGKNPFGSSPLCTCRQHDATRASVS